MLSREIRVSDSQGLTHPLHPQPTSPSSSRLEWRERIAPPGGTLDPQRLHQSSCCAHQDAPMHCNENDFLPGLPPSPFSPGAPGTPSRPSRPSRPGRPWLPWWPGVPGRPGCPGHRLGILLSSRGGEPDTRLRSSRARSGLMVVTQEAQTPGSSLVVCRLGRTRVGTQNLRTNLAPHPRGTQ